MRVLVIVLLVFAAIPVSPTAVSSKSSSKDDREVWAKRILPVLSKNQELLDAGDMDMLRAMINSELDVPSDKVAVFNEVMEELIVNAQPKSKLKKSDSFDDIDAEQLAWLEAEAKLYKAQQVVDLATVDAELRQLGKRRVAVGDDGLCQYYSFLYHTTNGASHNDAGAAFRLRTEVVDHLIERLATDDNVKAITALLFEEAGCGHLATFAKKARCTYDKPNDKSTWGDEVTAQAFASLKNRKVKIYFPDGAADGYHLAHHAVINPDAPGEVVEIFHVNGNHYEPVVPLAQDGAQADGGASKKSSGSGAQADGGASKKSSGSPSGSPVKQKASKASLKGVVKWLLSSTTKSKSKSKK